MLWLTGAREGSLSATPGATAAAAGPHPIRATAPPGIAAPPGQTWLADDFSSRRHGSLTAGAGTDTRYTFADGAYLIEVGAPDTVAWSLADGEFDDVAVQVEAMLIAGPETAASGLIFHYQDDNNFYLFSVAANGFYSLEMLRHGEWTILIDWTAAEAIAGRGELNTLRVETRGDRIALSVNGVRLEETADATLSGGKVALAVRTFAGRGATVRFDNLLVAKNDA